MKQPSDNKTPVMFTGTVKISRAYARTPDQKIAMAIRAHTKYCNSFSESGVWSSTSSNQIWSETLGSHITGKERDQRIEAGLQQSPSGCDYQGTLGNLQRRRRRVSQARRF